MSNRDSIVGDLARTTEPGTDKLAELHNRLAEAAQRDGLLDIAYRTMDSPIGSLLLAATEQGIVRIAYAREDHDAVLAQLADKVSPRILHAPVRLDIAARELDEYFARTRRTFDLPLDWRLAAGFRAAVLQHLPEIGYGQTASYATVAALAGRPKAVRAVGTACAKNPLPVVVPCHRVVRSDGAMGGYLGARRLSACCSTSKRRLMAKIRMRPPGCGKPASEHPPGADDHRAQPSGQSCAAPAVQPVD